MRKFRSPLAISLVSLLLVAGLLLTFWQNPLEKESRSSLTKGDSSTPTYDTRPCLAHPSRTSCDGRLPIAPRDVPAFSGREGNEACLDGSLRPLTEKPLDPVHPAMGSIQLIWLPPCHSVYAALRVNRAVTQMTITIFSPQTHRTFSSSQKLAGFSEVNNLVSPLLFVSADEPLVAFVQLHLLDGSVLSTSVAGQALSQKDVN